MKTITATLCCLLLSVFASRAAGFDLGTHGTLSAAVPDGWRVVGGPANNPNETGIGYALNFRPNNDANAKCMLTFDYDAAGKEFKAMIKIINSLKVVPKTAK